MGHKTTPVAIIYSNALVNELKHCSRRVGRMKPDSPPVLQILKLKKLAVNYHRAVVTDLILSPFHRAPDNRIRPGISSKVPQTT